MCGKLAQQAVIQELSPPSAMSFDFAVEQQRAMAKQCGNIAGGALARHVLATKHGEGHRQILSSSTFGSSEYARADVYQVMMMIGAG